MRYSQMHIPTLKEAPKEAELIGHQFLVRGGFIRKLSSGIYDFLPLGIRTLLKVETIIREEMNRADAQEVLMPAVLPAELWMESGRWRLYGPELLRFKDRKGGDFCIGPTHEEVIVDLVRRDVRSYKNLPVNLYQIQAKFRDEIRPRAGLLRAREFIMKDAYSFDRDEESAKISYQKMHNAYTRIFARCGFDFRCVEADTGNIGGTLSHEFQVLADTGEDAMVLCHSCGYTANLDKAEIRFDCSSHPAYSENFKEIKKVHTPDMRTVEEVCSFVGVTSDRLVKTLLYIADEKPVAALIRGDRELNEVKFKNLLKCNELIMADEEMVKKLTNSPVGFAGPLNLNVELYSDIHVKDLKNFVVGANEEDMHFINVNIPRDFKPLGYLDLSLAVQGDRCGKCGTELKFYRGIEVGHIFYLGTKYSKPMKCNFLDENGEEKPMIMGCYGIGVTRIIQAVAEQSHDEKGIIWPVSLAPFHVIIVPLNTDDKKVIDAAEEIYLELINKNCEVIIDDREERPGIKLNDADLIGIPIQIIAGKKSLEKGDVEIRMRKEISKAESLKIKDAGHYVFQKVQEELKKYEI